MDDAIVVRQLGKRYHRSQGSRPRTLKEALVRGFRQKGPVDSFWAVRDVHFRLAPGRMLGVIGRNGAGKSTLLRLLGKVGLPDEGSVETNGRIGALLDLGAGFQPDLTGRENVFVRGVIAGLTRREIANRFDAIVDFAELEDAIDSPLRTYSTGMQMRLGFAVAVHTDPELLLVDEVLAVGDIAFQRKCAERIAHYKSRGCAIVLVSHDVGQVARLCDEALWLREGRVAAHGPAEVVATEYESEMERETRRRTPTTGTLPHSPSSDGMSLRAHENRFGSLEIEIVAVRLLNRRGLPARELPSGDPLRIEIDYVAHRPVAGAIFGISLQREDGVMCFDTSTESAGITLPLVSGAGTIALTMDRLDLNGDAYFVHVGAYHPRWEYAYDYHWRAYPLSIYQPEPVKGILYPPNRWEVAPASAQEPAAAEVLSPVALPGEHISSGAR